MNTDGIYLNKGCVVSDAKISFDKNGKMRLLLDGSMFDTLMLNRITDIQ
jgi:hypothetical protein